MTPTQPELRLPPPRIGVIILNWKRPDDTRACVASLLQQDYSQFEIVVVDNASDDGSPADLRRRFPNITVIENKRNLGFAGGCNVGIKHLLDRGVKYVLLLNDDTESATDLLRQLVTVAESDPNIGIVGPKIYYYRPDNLIWSAGGTIGERGNPTHRRVDEIDDGRLEPIEDVDYVTGCAMLIKRAVIDSTGTLDERFFAYYEETEWCVRARKAGFRVVYAPAARMWHKLEPTARGSSPLYLYLTTRNRLLFLRCTGATLMTTLRTMLELVRMSAAWRFRRRHQHMRQHSGVVLRGVWDFMLGRFGAPPALP